MIWNGLGPGACGRTRAMAQRAGVDLRAAAVDGWLTRADLEALVARCARCSHIAGCERDPAAGLAANALPADCANGPMLECLRGL